MESSLPTEGQSPFIIPHMHSITSQSLLSLKDSLSLFRLSLVTHRVLFINTALPATAISFPLWCAPRLSVRRDSGQRCWLLFLRKEDCSSPWHLEYRGIHTSGSQLWAFRGQSCGVVQHPRVTQASKTRKGNEIEALGRRDWVMGRGPLGSAPVSFIWPQRTCFSSDI